MSVSFLAVYVILMSFPLSICYAYVLSVGVMLLLHPFGFGCKVIWDGRGAVCFTQRARKELWRENPFITTTAAQLGRGE